MVDVTTLSQEELDEIKQKLIEIRDSFVPNDEQFVCNTFYLTSTYNQENPEMMINGNICEMLLGGE